MIGGAVPLPLRRPCQLVRWSLPEWMGAPLSPRHDGTVPLPLSPGPCQFRALLGTGSPFDRCTVWMDYMDMNTPLAPLASLLSPRGGGRPPFPPHPHGASFIELKIKHYCDDDKRGFRVVHWCGTMPGDGELEKWMPAGPPTECPQSFVKPSTLTPDAATVFWQGKHHWEDATEFKLWSG